MGGRLARHLQLAGYSILLGSRWELKSPDWLIGAQTIKINWNDAAALEIMCSKVDVIVHAAGINAQQCSSDPVAALEFNGVATARLVSAACKAGVKRFIYLSTAHVYGSAFEGNITEETYPSNLHPYATSHLAGERAVLHAAERYKIAAIVLRLSNAFGAPTHGDVNCWMLLVNDLCAQAAQTHKMTLNSSGQQQRDFISIIDFCFFAEKFVKGGFYSGVFNIGSGYSKSVIDMAEIIQKRCEKVLGFRPKLEVKQNGHRKTPDKLHYRSLHLDQLEPNIISSNSLTEIDNLLKFCAASSN